MTTALQPPAARGDTTLCLVLPLDYPAGAARVGGKAHALGRLARAGLRVPPGVAITTAALELHLAPDGRDAAIAACCAGLDPRRPDALRSAAERARALVLDAPMPDEVRRQLLAAAAPLLAQGPVVVRSSAVGEDGLRESFAGQLDSVLHVATADALLAALAACWASCWTERALFYRLARGLPARGMGVVVQRQVDALAAGVLFTDAGDGRLLVEYAPGLGDGLVSGAVDPGRFTLSRDGRRVERLAAPATLDAAVERALFASDAIASLAALADGVERVFGAPQDVEWVLDHDGVVHVVQSRPITAPVRLPPAATTKAVTTEAVTTGAATTGAASAARRVVWSNANVAENFPAPISPLLHSIVTTGYTHYFRNLARAFGIAPARVRAMEPAFRQIVGVHGGRLYYNLSSIHAVLHLAPFGAALTGAFDRFVGADGATAAAGDGAPPAAGRARQLGELAVVAARTARQYVRLERRVRRFERTVDAFAGRTHPARLAGRSAGELRAALAEFLEIRRHRWTDAALADCAAMVCYAALQALLRRALGDEAGARHNALLRAIPGVVSNEPVHGLWALSRHVRRDAALRQLVAGESSDAVLARVERDPAFASFRGELRRYLEAWGFRCSQELMLTLPSLEEEPAPVIDLLRAYAQLDGDSPVDALHAQAAMREAETARVLRAVRERRSIGGVPGVAYARLVRLVLAWTHASIRFRERARLKQALLYTRCRRVALAAGERLVAAGLLASRDDVFWLTIEELDELLAGGAMLPHHARELVALRARAHAETSAAAPPDRFTLGEGEYLPLRPGAGTAGGADDPSGDASLVGTGACGGRVTARATVLQDVTEAGRLARGDVLVTRQTDPGWGPVFFLIGGLVIERGGMLSHGAIIAREFGIPCVVAVRDATRRVPEGRMVTVDGDRGTVHVLD